MIDGRSAIDIEHLQVAAGELAAVIGSPGSGVDALLDLLIGRSRPTAGTVRLNGIDPASDHAGLSSTVGFLFAENALYPRRSPRSHLLFDCRLRGLPKARVTTTLSEVGLADHADVKAEKLAPGLQRRLAFGRAIIHQPRVLILAEPFSACDDATVDLLSRRLRLLATGEPQQGIGTSVLVLAHDATHLARLCDIIHVMDRGRIVESREPGADQTAALPLKIPVRLEGEVALVNPADILYAAAAEGRSMLHTVNGDLPTQFTLGELEERLSRRGFFRAHRSYLVNLQHVKSVIPYTRNAFSLILEDADETEIPLSKSAAAELRELLGY
jgi:ABC-2 type transport system ATP-binding protein